MGAKGAQKNIRFQCRNMFHDDSEQLGVIESPKPKLMRILNLHYFMTFFFLPCVGQWGTKNRIAQNHLKCITGERSLVIDNFLLSLQCGNSGVWGTKSEVSPTTHPTHRKVFCLERTQIQF